MYYPIYYLFIINYPIYLFIPSGKDFHLPMQEIQEMQVRSLGREDPLEDEMATHSSILTWKISQTEEPACGVQSMGLQRARHD